MPSIPESDLLLALLGLAVIVLGGRAVGVLARRLGQPEVLGQLFAGVLLGHSGFGVLLPTTYRLVVGNHTVVAVLSTLSWIGVIFLLTLAGSEVNMAALQERIKPSILTATGAIIPSLVAGALFTQLVLGIGGFYLGIVLAVTAMSELSAILLERNQLERGYAQVMLAAGVISEIVVWPLVSIASSLGAEPAWISIARASAAVFGFFLIALTVGRWFLYQSLRRVADLVPLRYGVFTLILTFALLAGDGTQALGLHVVLGAFVFGLLLHHAPRFTEPLQKRLEAVTIAFFGPLFFVIAGTLVDLSQIRGPSTLVAIPLLLLVATLVKVGFAGLGARLGGLPNAQALLVGVGLNFRGGTALTVAIIGVELGLLSSAAFTIYAVVTIIVVATTPALLNWLAERSPPTPEEQAQLARATAARQSYVALLQRVLLPQDPQLRPLLTAEVAKVAIEARLKVDEPVDLVEIVPQPSQVDTEVQSQVAATLSRAETERGFHVFREVVGPDIVQGVLETARPGDILSIGADPPSAQGRFSLGSLHDALLRNGKVDVTATIARDHFCRTKVRRILTAVSGLEYTLAGADLAALLASGFGAEVVVLTVVQPLTAWPVVPDYAHLRRTGQSIVREAASRLRRFDIRVSERVRVGEDVAGEILEELASGNYQLVVLGTTGQGRGDQIYFGGPVETVVLQAKIPVMLFVAHALRTAIELE